MQIKLNPLQQKKYYLIRKYLETETGKKRGLLLNIEGSKNKYALSMLYINGLGIHIKGNPYPKGKYSIDRLLDGTEITSIYKAGILGDNDFRNFAKKEKEKKSFQEGKKNEN